MKQEHTMKTPSPYVRLGLILLACLSILATTACQQPQAASSPADGKMLVIEHQVTGDLAPATHQQTLLIKDAQKLAKVHEQLLDWLAVDFAKQAIVFWSMGEKPSGGYGGTIESVREVGSVLHVTVRVHAPGPDDMVTMALTCPFAAAVIPQTQAREVRVTLVER